MKKWFFVFMAVICLGLSANAQMCRTTANVEGTISVSDKPNIDLVTVSFQNYNNYMVTIDYTLTIVDSNAGERTYTGSIVVNANETKATRSFNSTGSSTIANDCSIEFKVYKCD